jgi:putative DNA primase/helicase
LTADTSYEIALWLYGPRGSGRSTFIEGLLAMLGARAGRLSLRDIAESRFGLPAVVGKTMVYATESPADYIESADTIINVISGEVVMIEQKGKDAYQYRPGAKIVWAMNELPQFRDQQSGLWRRVKVVEFPALKVEPNPDVKEAIKREGAGILVWALEGLRRLRQRGSFDIPESVEATTEAYRRSNDIAAEFVADLGIESAPEGLCPAAVLIRAYNTWRHLRAYSRVSEVSAAADWKRLGFEKVRRNDGQHYRISPNADAIRTKVARYAV